MTRTVTTRHVAEMVAFAEEGLSRTDIAIRTGWSVQTVGKHVGHLVARRDINRMADLARYRRMLKAAAAAQYGAREDIARRFGLANAKCLSVTLITARRRVEAEGENA